jgi:uncharacterized protein
MTMLPLFPLPNVVLFPKAYLPLHIFEQRYRAMVQDVLADERPIGMVLLREGWQDASLQTPPIYATGCAGVIVHHERLADGRFNVVLRGTRKFRVRSEVLARPYREAEVDWLDGEEVPGPATSLATLRRRLDALLLPAIVSGGAQVPPTLSEEELVNAICQYLDIDVVEKLALLEKHGALARGEALVARIERLLVERERPGGAVH